AASSAPELIFDPEDSCCNVFDRLACVLFRLLSAYIAERLFKTPRDMGFSLRCVGLRPFPGCVLPFLFASLGCCCGVLPSHLDGFSAWVSLTLCEQRSVAGRDTFSTLLLIFDLPMRLPITTLCEELRVMIELTRLNGNPMVLNSDLIKTAEASPDTMLTLVNGEKLIVRESCEEVTKRVLGYRARLLAAVARRLPSRPDLLRVVSLASVGLSDQSG